MHKHFPQFTRPHLPIARVLRKNLTEAEQKLWSLLRRKQLGVKFRRQVPLNGYILDFYFVKAKLNVELDGSQHYTERGKQKDRERDNDLQKEGILILRFSSAEMLLNPDGVLQKIMDEIRERISQQTYK